MSRKGKGNLYKYDPRAHDSRKFLSLVLTGLWIKSGTVTICGAFLSASAATYRVYAPFSHPVPVIEVLSDTAEVELTSLDEGLQGLAKLSRKHLWDAPDGVEAIAGTFHVVSTSHECVNYATC